MGEIKAGDIIFSENGEPTTVLQSHGVEHKPEAYRFTFDDGSIIDSGADHFWYTFSNSELQSLSRKNPEWRKKRRYTRKSKVTGNKSVAFTASLTARNKRSPTPSTEPSGSVRSTLEIFHTLKTKSGRTNHAIQVCKPIILPSKDLPLDPYLLGVWLGDGSTGAGAITSADKEIPQSFADAGFEVVKIKDKYGWGIHGLYRILRLNGLIGRKHVPDIYMRSSVDQRIALVQGLMDTDGHARASGGGCEFVSTKKNLAESFCELLSSLGIKHSFKEGIAKLYGKDCGPKYRIQFSSSIPVFRLKRKLERQNTKNRRTISFRYIVACEKIQTTPMRCITVDSKSHLYLAGKQMVPTHNTLALLLDQARWAAHVRDFRGLIFRRTYSDIMNPGGLWDESAKLLPVMGAKAQRNECRWHWADTDSSIKFNHMQHDSDIESWQGSQPTVVAFDEVTHFSESVFWYMLSRLRSTCGVIPYLRATCNPDSSSWVAKLIEWWIDQATGFPDPKRAGVLRWIIRRGDSIIWGERKDDPVFCGDESISLTFIPAKLTDNPALMAADPDYLTKLKNLPAFERATLLDGNWHVRRIRGVIFKRENFNVIPSIPGDIVKWVRYWDRASTAASAANPDPDATSGTLMGRRPNGRFVIADEKNIRATPQQVIEVIKRTAAQDPPGTELWLEQDPGQAGVAEISYLVRELAGYIIKTNRVNTAKIVRAKPLAAQVEQGNVDIIFGPWTDAYLLEMDNFIDESQIKATRGYHDDRVDSSSGAFNAICFVPAPRIR